MLYLVDEPLADLAARTIADDEDARVVLIQDGVLLDVDVDAPTFAVERDVAVRGVDLPDDVDRVSYDEVVAMIEAWEVRSFV